MLKYKDETIGMGVVDFTEVNEKIEKKADKTDVVAKAQGEANKGKTLVVGEDGNVVAKKVEDYATLPTGSNLDNLKTNGAYYLYGSYSYTNIPTGVTNGYLQVLNHEGSSAVKQILYRIGTIGTNDYEIYERTTTGTTWSAWVKVLTEKQTTHTISYTSTSGTTKTITVFGK